MALERPSIFILLTPVNPRKSFRKSQEFPESRIQSGTFQLLRANRISVARPSDFYAFEGLHMWRNRNAQPPFLLNAWRPQTSAPALPRLPSDHPRAQVAMEQHGTMGPIPIIPNHSYLSQISFSTAPTFDKSEVWLLSFLPKKDVINHCSRICVGYIIYFSLAMTNPCLKRFQVAASLLYLRVQVDERPTDQYSDIGGLEKQLGSAKLDDQGLVAVIFVKGYWVA